jgi:hypothetical protein
MAGTENERRWTRSRDGKKESTCLAWHASGWEGSEWAEEEETSNVLVKILQAKGKMLVAEDNDTRKSHCSDSMYLKGPRYL